MAHPCQRQLVLESQLLQPHPLSHKPNPVPSAYFRSLTQVGECTVISLFLAVYTLNNGEFIAFSNPVLSLI